MRVYYSIFHCFATLTTMNAMKATIMKVISADMKLPYMNSCPFITNDAVAKLPNPGSAKPINGITKPVTNA